jgi:hypothetical protein
MPIKVPRATPKPFVKKNKKVIKQKQKQSQRQVVNIKIGEIKKAAAKRRAAVKRPAQPIVQQSVQPVQYMYQSTGSAPIPQSFQNIGVSQPPRANILGEQPLSAEVQREIQRTERAVKSAEKQLEIGSSALARENILGGARIQPEDIRRQRELTLSQPQEASLYGETTLPSETSVRYSGIFGSASSFEGDNPMAAGGGSAVSSITDIPTRTPRFYKNRQTLIREILRATSDFSVEELKSMDTMRVREIYDRFYK